MKSSAQLHWDYFRLLEKDLISISETLEICEANFQSFGPRIVQLVLNAGSEIDVALKTLADVLGYQLRSRPTIQDFKKMILQQASEQFTTARVRFLHTDLTLTPWSPLESGQDASLLWWTSYNNIKHQRAKHYETANLKTALDLFAALFVVNAYISEASLEPDHGFTHIVDWHSHKYMPKLEEYYAASK